MMYSPFYLALLGSAAATAAVPNSVATARLSLKRIASSSQSRLSASTVLILLLSKPYETTRKSHS